MTKTASKPAEANGTGKGTTKPVKEKRRNNEKRKEKSRDAARCRRSRETEIFQDLAGLLPMPAEEVEHLDKASVMRLSIAFLKARNMLELFPELSQKSTEEQLAIKKDTDDASMDHEDNFVSAEAKQSLNLLELEPEMVALQALDGFLMILSAEGDVTYISENVSEYLGISQIDIMGQPIWEYSHQCDHDELREALNGRHHSPSELLNGVANSDCRPMENRDFFLRLKCTLTSRGRSVNIKSASYKVLHVTGHIACKDKEGQRQLVSIARPLPHPANIEVPLDSSTFLTKHTLGMKFSYVDDKMLSLLGYGPSDLLGKSLYDCHHGGDAEHLMGTFKHVISKGQSETCRYRFLAKTGGYAWVVTQATVINDKQKPHSVVCVNYVISGVENKDEILSYAQLEARQQLLPEEAEQCVSGVTSGVEPHNTAPVAAAENCAVPSSGVDIVTAEQTIATIPVRSGISQTPNVKLGANNNNNNNNNSAEELVELYSGGVASAGKVCVKVAAESEPTSNRILRELNSNNSSTVGGGFAPKPGSVPASAALPSVGRPVSVTASIFTSLPNGGSGGGGGGASGTQSAEKPKAIVKQLGTALQSQQSSPALLQSVTAKLFVTLPASGGASAGGCNGVSGGGSGAAGSKPQHATEKIFAPRTEDMNKGFLMFSEEEPGLTMLKDEPDDLTHLAPTAGDACIPLEESGTFFNDEMFDDFIIPDSYTLLQDELCSLDSQDTRLDGTSMVVQSVGSISTASPIPTSAGQQGQQQQEQLQQQLQHQHLHQTQHHQTPSPNNQTSPGSLSSSASSSSSSSPVPSSPSRSLSSHPSSPSGTSGLGSSASSAVSVSLDHSATGRSIGSQHNATSNDPFINYRDETSEVSPSPHLLSPGISKSPESSSLPSLCSPNGSLPEDDLAFMSLNMDEIDLTMRAPYISMSEVDDLPLLTSDDLLWGAPAATIDGSAHGGPFGLSGKFFIKDEFGALEQTRQQQQQHQLLIGKQSHGLITDITIGATNSSTSARTDEGNNDSKSTQQSPPPPQPSIESSLAALLCGGNVISIQAQETQPNASGNNASNQILIAQQQHSQQHHQQSEPETQCQQNGKRMKLLEESLLQHPMVVLPASLKLCDGWKFEDLLQLNGAATVKLSQQQAQQQTGSKKPNSPTNGTSHKRSLTGIDGVEPTETGLSCKRHKAGGSLSSSSSSSSSAPQLLQQLMAPSPVPQKLKGRGRAGQDGIGGRWPNGQLGGAAGMQQEQSGNSVLMNLLVSGCDVSAGYSCLPRPSKAAKA
ncbi:protein similar [Anopheles ziemanni]|uniref:protein similar-like n=1 Tax=Anopheles coustani TaxID=139045 RepID=UPI00265A6583|nr:protein similar-like [Anopheles coustani]XP_058173883.1 protein similar [Anopheles ziemanni]